MLTNIVKATRAHYAALQHKQTADRVPLYYSVQSSARETLTAGSIWVSVQTPSTHGHIYGQARKDLAKRKREMTKLENRLWDMFPEARTVHLWYSGEPSLERSVAWVQRHGAT